MHDFIKFSDIFVYYSYILFQSEQLYTLRRLYHILHCAQYNYIIHLIFLKWIKEQMVRTPSTIRNYEFLNKN